MSPLLEHKPVHVRRKLALGITVGFAVLLLVVMIVVYSAPKKDKGKNGAMTKIGQFYATILENTQSYFRDKDAIISK
ncbi:MAG: hypothetical protein AAB681_00910 [Patescibacteria group bacterium]